MNLNELQSLNIREVTELAQNLNIEGGIAGLNKQELIVKILETHAKKDNAFTARGVLEVMQDGYGFLRSPDYNYMPGPDDIYVSPSQIKRFTDAQREAEVKQESLPYKDRDHALFVAFAPYNNPQYAISVLVEHGGSGGKAAAPIAKKVIKKVLERHELRKKINSLIGESV